MGKAHKVERVPSAGKRVRGTPTPSVRIYQNPMLNNHSRYAEDVVQTHAALGLLLLSQRLPYEPSLIYSPGVLDPSRFFHTIYSDHSFAFSHSFSLTPLCSPPDLFLKCFFFRKEQAFKRG